MPNKYATAVLLDDVKRAVPFFFAPDTMRAFRSRIGDIGWPAPGGTVYFVTSERDGTAPRRYTVRRWAGGARIETVGSRQSYPTLASAEADARRFAASVTTCTRAHGETGSPCRFPTGHRGAHVTLTGMAFTDEASTTPPRTLAPGIRLYVTPGGAYVRAYDWPYARALGAVRRASAGERRAYLAGAGTEVPPNGARAVAVSTTSPETRG